VAVQSSNKKWFIETFKTNKTTQSFKKNSETSKTFFCKNNKKNVFSRKSCKTYKKYLPTPTKGQTLRIRMNSKRSKN